MAAGGSKSKKTATIIDVARLAGVSQQTVSRVANGSNLVREATRAKVQAAMKELGYSPNRQARALRNGRSKMIGLVINYLGNERCRRMVRLSQSQWSPLIGFLMMVIGLRVNCSTDILTVRRFMRLMMPSQVVLWRYVRNEAWWLDGMSA